MVFTVVFMLAIFHTVILLIWFIGSPGGMGEVRDGNDAIGGLCLEFQFEICLLVSCNACCNVDLPRSAGCPPFAAAACCMRLDQTIEPTIMPSICIGLKCWIWIEWMNECSHSFNNAFTRSNLIKFEFGNLIILTQAMRWPEARSSPCLSLSLRLCLMAVCTSHWPGRCLHILMETWLVYKHTHTTHTHLHILPHSLLVKTSFNAVASRFPLEVDDVDDDDTSGARRARGRYCWSRQRKSEQREGAWCIHRRQEKCQEGKLCKGQGIGHKALHKQKLHPRARKLERIIHFGIINKAVIAKWIL